MMVRERIKGFVIDRVRESGELGGSLYEMTHEKTGAQLIWLDNQESNMHFSIAFATPPTDDSGVFHILEHSVLNGSKKYKVKDPFLELLKSSMNTFLNAMTSADYTIYPVSSRNRKDFHNLVSVYLDAVFKPAIYENPNIFYQEGWHYELMDEEEEISYNGVVFNEMKGVFASPETKLSVGLNRLLFPDSSYQYVSGGDPKAIPSLSYEHFIEQHRKHYHPANARVYLEGRIDLEEILDLIGEYFELYDKGNGALFIPVGQKSVTGLRAQGRYQGMEEDKAYLTFGKLVCSHDQIIRRFSMNILANYLYGSNDSPVKKAVLEQELAQDIYAYLDESSKDMAFVTVAKQMNPEDEERLWDTLASVRERILKEGLDKAELSAIIARMEFENRQIEEPAALGRNMYMLSTWLYGGDPMDMLEFDSLFAELKRLLDTGHYEKMLMELPMAEKDSCLYLLTPSLNEDQKDMAEEVVKLKAIKASWCEEELLQVISLNKKLKDWQREEATPEQKKTLPTLSLDDVDREPVFMPGELIDKILFHKSREKGISHVNLYFSLTGLKEEEYSPVSFLTNLLGELPTKSSSLSLLQQRTKADIGFLDYNVSSYCKPGKEKLCHPYFVLSFSVLSEKMEEAIRLVCEILNETDFECEDTAFLIEDILCQCIFSMQENIIAEGDRFASMKAAGHISASSKAGDLLEGYGFYSWLKLFGENMDDMYDSFIALMHKLQKKVFNTANLTISLAAEEYDERLISVFDLLHKEGEEAAPDYAELELDNSIKNEAIEIPGGVSYAVMADSLYNYGMEADGLVYPLSKLISLDYLWKEIRVLGGAYGCSLVIGKSGLVLFGSYRDPNPSNSLQVFKNAGQFIRDYVNSDANFDNILISAAASLEPLLDSRREQEYADLDYFYGVSREEKRRVKQELLNMKKEDLLRFVKLFDQIALNGYSCITGPKAHIEGLQTDRICRL